MQHKSENHMTATSAFRLADMVQVQPEQQDEEEKGSLKRALAVGWYTVIFTHNHPSSLWWGKRENMGQNALLVVEVRGEWLNWFKLIEKQLQLKLGLGDMDQNSYLDIFKMYGDMQYI